MDKIGQEKLKDLNNENVIAEVEEAIKLCNPARVTVIANSKENTNYIRELAPNIGEEKKLKIEGHTIHFDGYYDQARDKEHTKYLLSEEVNGGLGVNYIEKDKGLK